MTFKVLALVVEQLLERLLKFLHRFVTTTFR